MTRQAIRAPYLFDGATLQANMAVLIDRGRISRVLRASDIPSGTPTFRHPRGTFVAPGLIDLQVNGGGGVLLNDALSVEGLAAIAEAHRALGTAYILPTLVSGSTRQIAAALDAGRAAIRSHVPGVLGLHIEGPFINPRRRGIHPASAVRLPSAVDLALLSAPFPAPLVLTLAPEIVSGEIVRALVTAGVIVLAGHTEANPEEVANARAAGLRGFTHLFNAMPPLSARSPGPAGAALADHEAFVSLICDGLHVHPAMLKAAIAAKGVNRVLLVSDAMPTVGASLASFRLGDSAITLAGGRLTDAKGTLAGAHLSLPQAVANAHRLLGLAPADALRIGTSVPARCLGLEGRLGAVLPGVPAELSLFDETLTLIGAWHEGVYVACDEVPPDSSHATTSAAFRSGGNTG